MERLPRPRLDPPEKGAWAPGLIMWVAIIACAFSVGFAAVGLQHLVEWSRPDAVVPVTLDVREQQEPVRGMANGGFPAVADGSGVVYTEAHLFVQGLPGTYGALLGLAEVVAGLTGAAVTGCLARIAGLLRRPDFAPSLLRPMSLAALLLAAGSTAAQLIEHAGRQQFASIVVEPPSASGPPRTLDASAISTFDGTWLIAAVGIVALGVVVQRALNLQAEAARLRVETRGLV